MRRIINNINNHQNWLTYYKYKYTGIGTDDFTFHCRTGLKIKVPARLMHTYKECFFDETYLKGMPSNLRNRPLSTIIDIGANVGYFSLFMLSQHKKANVYAYEPIPKNFELLSQYRSENPGYELHLFNEAVSNSDQTSIMLHYDDSDAFTTSASIFEDPNQKNEIEVKATNLEKIIRDNDLKQVDFVKIDCEGSEYEILYNTTDAVFDKLSMLSIETHQGKKETENTQALAKFIEEKSYEVHIQGDIIWAWKKDLSKN